MKRSDNGTKNGGQPNLSFYKDVIVYIGFSLKGTADETMGVYRPSIVLYYYYYYLAPTMLHIYLYINIFIYSTAILLQSFSFLITALFFNIYSDLSCKNGQV
ncbi:hypothetical protein CLU79DRAFT_106752 [Phycomyces nitens]|nr:hypothetical protein CLU79DRAFT_106752 [Phycomyces nitens]